MVVQIFGLDPTSRTAQSLELGSIILEKGHLRVVPDTPLLRDILAATLRISSQGGRLRTITRSEPEAFVRNLYKHFKSPYLYAGKPRSSDES